MEELRGFREVSDCPGWLINNEGVTWSSKINKTLKPHDNGRGYLQLVYTKREYRKKYYIHRLVAQTFIGNIPDKMTVNHKDGDVTNNKVENLEIISSGENNRHAREIGLVRKWRGSLHPHSKLTENDVIDIRNRHNSGEKAISIVKDYDISPATVYNVSSGKSWSWLKGGEDSCAF